MNRHDRRKNSRGMLLLCAAWVGSSLIVLALPRKMASPFWANLFLVALWVASGLFLALATASIHRIVAHAREGEKFPYLRFQRVKRTPGRREYDPVEPS